MANKNSRSVPTIQRQLTTKASAEKGTIRSLLMADKRAGGGEPSHSNQALVVVMFEKHVH